MSDLVMPSKGSSKSEGDARSETEGEPSMVMKRTKDRQNSTSPHSPCSSQSERRIFNISRCGLFRGLWFKAQTFLRTVYPERTT